jgi:hypothetical protein
MDAHTETADTAESVEPGGSEPEPTIVIPDPNPAPIIPDPNPNPEPAPIIPDPDPGSTPEPAGAPVVHA